MTKKWDVFISYAREESLPANRLYDKLLGCSTADGRRPIVFLDTSRDGIAPGEKWTSSLAEALQESRCFVPLYSPLYFDDRKTICKWELDEAFDLSMTAGLKIVPVVLDPACKPLVPHKLSRVQWQDTTDPDWFERVRHALGLTSGRPPGRLRFTGAALDRTTVNLTLPEIVVEAEGDTPAEIEVSARAATGAEVPFTGTAVRSPHGRTAVFSDLSFPAPYDRVRLVARAPGCDQATTGWFGVDPPGRPAPAPAGTGHPVLPGSGQPYFLSGGTAIALLGADEVVLYDLEARVLARAPAPTRIKDVAVGAESFAVADWSGRVVRLGTDGGTTTVDLPGENAANPLRVPSALVHDGADLLAGMWNGAVYRLAPGAAEPSRVAFLPEGVQTLAVAHGRLLAGRLDGAVAAFGPDGWQHALEPVLLGCRMVRGRLLVAGENRVYRVDPVTGEVAELSPPVGRQTGALFTEEGVVVVDADGRGVRIDHELSVRRGFHGNRGARLVAGDRTGRFLILSYPERAHVLMEDGRVVYTCDTGPMGVSPDASLIAEPTGGGVRVVPRTDLGG
ncbi:toll/interleukin-1 receptor domain-containing protein [Actinoplanes sp. NPDC051851]|uniref:toll/interleukin-1 receptor domain-containing protein n=1 Tax=Actinoplanes sp. NPDC051851 TaxID=3154753 RepID=UPI00343D2EED